MLVLYKKLITSVNSLFTQIKNFDYIKVFSTLYLIILDTLDAIKDFVFKVFEYQRLGVLFMFKNKEYTISKKADFKNLKKIREFLGKYSRRAGLLKKRVASAQLVIDEVVTNIIRHAYKGMDQGQVTVSCVLRKKRIDIIVRDYGIEFNWNSVLDPDLKKYVEVKRKGGLGIMLIRKLTNSAKYERKGNMNEFVLRFRRKKKNPFRTFQKCS